MWKKAKKRLKLMRDPNRTLPFCNELAAIWSEEFPDWRFGQLMYNFIIWYSNIKKRDIFFSEEKNLWNCLKNLVE